MVGRPRKTGKRKPCGRLAQVYVNPKAQVASQPHRKVVPIRFRDQPEAETAFGRLFVTHVDATHEDALERDLLTPARYEAGKRYAELYRGFQRAVHAPGHDPKAMDYTPRIAGKGDGISDGTAERLQDQWTKAYNEMAKVNLAWPQAVMHHAVHDRLVATERERKMLCCGLDILVKHFGIDARLQITPTRA